MKKLSALVLLAICAAILLGASGEPGLPPMPAAVSGNAVASLKRGFELFSMMGVGPRKTWDDITNQVYVMSLSSAKWHLGRPVPGVAGRLGASAAGAKGQIVLMGGYVVDARGEEIIVPDVNVYIEERNWHRGQDIPVPVDRAAVGVTHDRFVYLIGGRSAKGPVNNVQVYDVEKNSWAQATPFPGTPVFGLAGGIAGETIVIVDGAKPGPAGGPRYVASDECWLGKIDKKDPIKIEWSKLPPHPGPARFAIAGGGSEHEHQIFFSGGTATPHDYKGVAYDGEPSEASTFTFAYDLHHGRWETISEDTDDPRADSHLLETMIGPVLLGGMAKDLAVTAQVTLLPKK
ncbi:MAG: kelch repeat-containing protein [Candidatus Sulfotelmatobacter sp.]